MSADDRHAIVPFRVHSVLLTFRILVVGEGYSGKTKTQQEITEATEKEVLSLAFFLCALCDLLL